MSFYLQHGYGKGQKLQNLASTGRLAGVILSAADEDAQTLDNTAQEARRFGIDVRIDPQTYVYSTAPRGLGRKHDSHGVQFSDLHWSQDAKTVSKQVEAVGDLNRRLNPEGRWIAPSVVQSSFADVWTPLAVQLARTASEAWGPEKTIATLAIDDVALDTWRNVDEWLDVATTLEVAGFYILVGRSNTTYPPAAWSVDRLTNLLRLIYNLSELNGYEVTWGYSDSEGLLGIAAGADHMASGWSYSLRQFNAAKWQPSDSKGGRAATPRLHLEKLWSPLRAVSEADEIFKSKIRDEIFTEEQVANFSTRRFDSISRLEAQEMHLNLLATRASNLSRIESVSDRMDRVEKSLDRAIARFALIADAGIPLETRYRPRVESLKSALVNFRNSESL